MRDELVAIDLESTGLDLMTDAIIEVGAVRIRDGVVIDEFSTMVNPDKPIPPQITYITGIHQEDVAGAPSINAVLPQITAFVGASPLIAHNISLDMGFLQDRHGILRGNGRIDTYDLAAVLMPTAPRYNLNSLATQVGVDLDNAHRALDDARATALLYWELWKKALQLPYDLLQEITIAAHELNWDAYLVFSEALKEQNTHNDTHPKTTIGNFPPLPKQAEKLTPKTPHTPLNVDAVQAHVGADSTLAAHIPNFEPREQQSEMVGLIAEAFNTSSHLMVEAGTGTGKSLAYLLPALLWSTENQERVVISTNTINLQDQLITKDIPLLQQTVETPFKATVMKGRGNYLCPRRLETVRRRKPTTIIELKTMAKIMVWLLESTSGDRNEISLRGPAENSVWNRLSAQDEDCSLHRCEATMEGICPFYKARKAAESANLLVVNHALLISDAHSENRVLPDYRYAIIDEAHQLEDAITHGLSFHLDKAIVTRRLADLGGMNKGLFGEIVTKTRDKITEKERLRLEHFVQSISEATQMMQVHVDNLFRALLKFINDAHESRPNEFMTLVRVEPRFRSRLSFAQVQAVWKALEEFFEVISAAMYRLTKALGKMDTSAIPDLPDLISSTETAGRYLEEIRQQLHNVLIEPDNQLVFWLSLSQSKDDLVIHTAPLHIGPMMEKHLWHGKESVILSSATLQTHDSFDYIKDRLYADSVKAVEIGSPFDYNASAMLYLPDDIPEPSDRQGYQKAVEQAIIDLSIALQGRVMVLFTSYTQLRQTSQAVAGRLAADNITVYDQSDGTSRQSMLEGFKTTDKAVLLGTKSFWEGVDIPGDSLSALIITRLPFAVPSDPVFASRSDTYSDNFNDYALPDAIIRFRQGFGRLIRSQTDRGVVVMLDRRIVSKGYGLSFLEALPDCTMQSGSLKNLPKAAKKWLQPES